MFITFQRTKPASIAEKNASAEKSENRSLFRVNPIVTTTQLFAGERFVLNQ
jgi:hypothetical protein